VVHSVVHSFKSSDEKDGRLNVITVQYLMSCLPDVPRRIRSLNMEDVRTRLITDGVYFFLFNPQSVLGHSAIMLSVSTNNM
jgi:hypothetical protein